MKRKRFHLIPLVVPLLALTGCGSTATIDRFQTFATYGTNYTTAVDGLLSDTGDSGLPRLLIEANSRRLLESRELAPVSEADLRKQDEDMRRQVHDLRLLKRQVDLLGQYFSALASLADSSASDTIADDLGDIGQSLSTLAKTLGDTNKLATDASTVKTAVSDIGNLVVKGVQADLLRKELDTRGADIAKVLRQQAEMLKALAEQAERAQGFLNQQDYDQTVVAPFLAPTHPDTDKWTQARQDGLLMMSVPDSLQDAVQAASSLRVAWVSLLANELDADDLEAVSQPLASIDARQSSSQGSGSSSSASDKERKAP